MTECESRRAIAAPVSRAVRAALEAGAFRLLCRMTPEQAARLMALYREEITAPAQRGQEKEDGI
ncbi:MAG: hypothetical protein K2K53_12125 [Oscillospiraceae bacterium]|nr:hypothetical protein [Oscillospiraceae bacterium]